MAILIRYIFLTVILSLCFSVIKNSVADIDKRWDMIEFDLVYTSLRNNQTPTLRFSSDNLIAFSDNITMTIVNGEIKDMRTKLILYVKNSTVSLCKSELKCKKPTATISVTTITEKPVPKVPNGDPANLTVNSIVYKGTDNEIELKQDNCSDKRSIIENVRSQIVEFENSLRGVVLLNGTFKRTFNRCDFCFMAEYLPDKTFLGVINVKMSLINCLEIKNSRLTAGHNGFGETYHFSPDLFLPDTEITGLEHKRKKRETDIFVSLHDSDDLKEIKTIIKESLNIRFGQSEDYQIPPGNMITRIMKLSKLPKCEGISSYLSKECVRAHITTHVTTKGLCWVAAVCKRPGYILHMGKCQVDQTVYGKVCRTYKFIEDNKVNCSLSSNLPALDSSLKYDKLNVCSLKILGKERSFRQCKNQRKYFDSLSLIMDGQDKFFVTKRINEQHIYQPNNISSYNCSNDCMNGNCNGDEIFKEHFSYSNSGEFCSFNKESYDLLLVKNSDLFKPKCVLQLTTEYVMEEGTEKKIVNNVDKIIIHCTQTGLDYNLYDFSISIIKICNEYQCMIKKDVSEIGFFRILPSFYQKGKTNLTVDIILNSNLGRFTRNVYCPVIDSCDLISCLVCKEKWLSAHCFNFFEWIIVIIFLLLLIFLFLTILKYSIKVGYSVFILLYYPIVLIKYICLKIKGKFRRTKSAVDKNFTEMEELIKEPKKPIVKKHSKKRSLLLLPLILFTIMTEVQGLCEKHSSLVLKQTDCVSGKSCSVTTSARINLGSKGTSSCYLIKDTNHIGLSEIYITTVDYGLYCNKIISYYVPIPKISCISSHRCSGAGSCDQDFCERVNVNTTIEELKEEEGINGKNYCDRVCGCAGCGCFYCTTSCVFTRILFKNPTKEYIEVSRCSSWSVFIDVIIGIKNKKENKEKKVRLHPTSTDRIFDIDLTIMSSVKPILPLIDKCFLQYRKGISVSECSPRNNPTKGMIGEIQCSLSQDARSFSKACIMSDGLWIKTTNDRSTKCQQLLVDPLKVIDTEPLPQLYPEGLLWHDSTNLYFSLRQSSSYELQLDIKNMDIEYTYNKAICYVDFISLSGCYSCKSGSKLKISVKVDGGSTLAVIICPSLLSPYSLSINGNNEYELITNFGYNKISEKCQIICSGGNTTFSINGNLDYIPLIDISDKSTMIISHDHSVNFDFYSIFESFWFKTIITGIIIMIILTLSYSLIKYILFKKKII